MEDHERAAAHEMVLRVPAYLVAGGQGIEEQAVDLGGLLLGDLHAERLGKLAAHHLQAILGIGLCHLATLGGTHALAPEEAREVVREGCRQAVGRREGCL